MFSLTFLCIRLLCGKILPEGRKYCDANCRDTDKKEKGTVSLNCKACGKPFSRMKSQVKSKDVFCKQSCKGGKIEKVCLFCEKPFLAPRKKVNKGQGKYCSKLCMEGDRSKKAAVILTCNACNKEFSRPRAEVREYGKHYCSRQCRNKNTVEKICLNCNNPFTISEYTSRQPNSGKYCSIKCRRIYNRLGNHRKKEIILRGYPACYVPEHPFATRGYVTKARLIVEKNIKRYLRKDEAVTYRDKNRFNLDINNLILAKKSKIGSFKKDKLLRQKIVYWRFQTIWDDKLQMERPLYNREIGEKVGRCTSFVSQILQEMGFSKVEQQKEKHIRIIVSETKKVWATL